MRPAGTCYVCEGCGSTSGCAEPFQLGRDSHLGDGYTPGGVPVVPLSNSRRRSATDGDEEDCGTKSRRGSRPRPTTPSAEELLDVRWATRTRLDAEAVSQRSTSASNPQDDLGRPLSEPRHPELLMRQVYSRTSSLVKRSHASLACEYQAHLHELSATRPPRLRRIVLPACAGDHVIASNSHNSRAMPAEARGGR